MRRMRGDKEEGERLNGGDSLVKLLRLVASLMIFVGGVVIGLASSSHVTRYFTSQADIFYTNRGSGSGGYSYYTSEENCSVIQMIVSCPKEDCWSMESFLGPKNLTHGMSDKELLWRASLVPYQQGYPYPRVPKVAFMFLTRGPLPMLPLWEKFFKGHEKLFSIYVHAPSGFKLNVTNSSVFLNRVIPSKAVQWGLSTLTDAEKRLLANALLDFSNEQFILLSESCIPIYNFPTVYKYLINSAHSFVESYDDPSRYGRGRYSRSMFPDIKLKHWRKGSQWFEMNRAVAIYVISDTKYYNIFRKYCRPSCYPDEHYIPTFLNMFHGSLNANRSITWVDWSLGGPHPALHGASNITEGFMQSIRNNGTCSYNSEKTSICHLFARKFAPSALEPLLNISSKVMRF
ncbi:Glycosyl transferase, family 14 [Dillenia turbinata]|uniref:Glycosyl transferase, family 14 n=1 Tax=Dillenia turbinata TaxID=194707 RepID=A0AAN8UFJ7_9MAGN